MKTEEIFTKVKATATAAGQAAARAADKTAKTAERFVETTKMQYQIYELKGEADALYRAIGVLMHDAHQDKPVEEGSLQDLLTQLDEKLAELSEMRDRKAAAQNKKICRQCGQASEQTLAFCGACGTAFEVEEEAEACGDESCSEETCSDETCSDETCSDESCSDEACGDETCGQEAEPIEAE